MSDLQCAGPLDNRTQKRVLVINDLSCFGKCSLAVSLPILAVCGVEAIPLPTAILSTHTGGFPSPYILSTTAAMQDIIKHWRSIGLRFDAIYSGYLCGEEQIDAVERLIDEFSDPHTLCMIDPVMGDGGKLYSGFSPSYVTHMKRLCARAHVITPNMTEAALLTGRDPADMVSENVQREVFDALMELGAPAAVMTGVTHADGTVGYLLADRAHPQPREIRHHYVDRMLHGCGDAFASALCASLLRELRLEDAVRTAADYTLDCIQATVPDAPCHWYGLKFEAGLAALQSRLFH